MSIKKNILGALTLCMDLIKEGVCYKNIAEHVEMLTPHGNWTDCPRGSIFNPLNGKKYRRKPETITVNGVQVPAPLSVQPEKSTKYYYISQTHERGYKSATWRSDQFDTLVFKRGIYTNEDHIKQYVKALWGE